MKNHDLVSLCKKIALDLSEPQLVKKNITAKDNLSLVGITPWEDLSLTAGYPALTVLFSELDRIFPTEGWDEYGYRCLLEVQTAIGKNGYNKSISLFTGLTGIAFSVRLSSRNGTRYKKFLNALDQIIFDLTEEKLQTLGKKANMGVSPFWYDNIMGLAGTARYLLLVENKRSKVLVLKILEYLVQLNNDINIKNNVFHGWYVPQKYLFTESDKKKYPKGVYNCGMAHGISGVLSLLSIAYMNNIVVSGQQQAIFDIGNWLIDHVEVQKRGLVWPSFISLEKYFDNSKESVRDAWCYGTAGVSRSLYLAGTAIKNVTFRHFSKLGFESIYYRRVSEWNLDGPTFCHGLSGLLQIINRMSLDTNNDMYEFLKKKILQEILKKYSEEFTYKFKDEEGSHWVDKIGLIDGVVGILLTLLSSTDSLDNKYQWDYAFLIA